MDKLDAKLENVMDLVRVANDLGGANPRVGVVDMEYAEYIGRQASAKMDSLVWEIENAEQELATLKERVEACKKSLIV